MVAGELFLQGDDALDAQVGARVDYIGGEIARLKEANPHHEPINPLVYNYDRLLDSANTYALIVGAETTEQVEVAAKGALFAREVVMLVYGDSVLLASVGSLVPEETPQDEIVSLVQQKVRQYRLQRPNIDMLIQKYRFEIDTTGEHRRLVEDVVSLLFILAEQADAERREEAWLEELARLSGLDEQDQA